MGKLNPYLFAAAISGACAGGWIGDAAGIAHVALRGKDAKQAYNDVRSMNIFTQDYAPILVYDLAGKAIGGLLGVALATRKKEYKLIRC